HLKAPWTEVTEMDGAVQIDQHTGDHRIKVRLGNSSTADADVSVRWQIKPDATPDLFVQYKTFDNVRSNLVTRNLQVALNEVFASFDPLAPQNLDRSPLPELSEKAKVILAAKVGDQVEILDVAVPTIDYDDGTEQKINQLNQERAATAVAEQAKKTAVEQAKANGELAGSVSHDPNVLVSKCLDIAREKGLALLCWPTPVMPTIPTK
ncbi:SPFH domain-containing protein, partial [Mycobacteroides abscessus]